VNFVELERHVRFEISLTAAERSKLKINSGLLSVAAYVEGARPRADISCWQTLAFGFTPACALRAALAHNDPRGAAGARTEARGNACHIHEPQLARCQSPGCSRCAAGGQCTALSPQMADSGADEQLKRLSLEELANVEVTSASKSTQPLSEAPAAIYVISHDDIVRSGAQSIPEVAAPRSKPAGHAD
jgi:hypothetical protein